MGEFRSYGQGYTGTELFMVAKNEATFNPRFPVVLYTHGYGGSGWSQGIQQFGGEVADALTDIGFLVIGLDVGGQLWGNSTAIALMNIAITWAQTNHGVKSSKAHALGFSMGGLTSINFGNMSPSTCASVSALNPAYDLTTFHNSFGGFYAASIEAAFGGAGSWTATGQNGGYSPLAEAFNNTRFTVPMKIWYNLDDPTVLPSGIEGLKFFLQFYGKSPALVKFRNNGNGGGHTPVSTSPFEVASWIRSNTTLA